MTTSQLGRLSLTRVGLRCLIAFFGILVVLLVSDASATQSQQPIDGLITDSVTGVALTGATVQIEGTFVGTVVNSEGRFSLLISSYPVVLVTRFIGYKSSRITLREPPSDLLGISLDPSSILLSEITVTDEDPAVGIMRRVIEEKAEWQKLLNTYRVDAYNRLRMENDSGIVAIRESGTKAFWDRDRGVREISVWQRQTDNMNLDELVPASILVQNLYDDELEVVWHTIMGVTHPNALSYYDFSLVGTRPMDGLTVFDIAVNPKSDLSTGFSGRIAVLDSLFAMLEVDLVPSGAFYFPPPIDNLDITLKQQFSQFGSDVWLPVDFRFSMNADISFIGLFTFPTIHIHQLSRLSNFELNVAVPDSLYDSDDIVIAASNRLREVGSASKNIMAVPLTRHEELAYDNIDSTMTFKKAYRPSGILADKVELRVDSWSSVEDGQSGSTWLSTLSPLLWYNRVEGFHAGLKMSRNLGRNLRINARAGYQTARQGWTYGLSARIGDQIWVETGYIDHVPVRYQSDIQNRLLNSLNVLASQPDYFDYLHERRWYIAVGGRISFVSGLSWNAEYADLKHENEEARITSGLVGGKLDYFDNAGADETLNKTVSARLSYDGDRYSMGFGPEYRIWVEAERDLSDTLDGRKKYTRIAGAVVWRFPTFFRHRFIQNTLDIKITAQTSNKALPPQRRGIVDASVLLSTFGALRTIHNRPYEGDRYFAVMWEHSFRSVLFERLGWKNAARKGFNLIIHGAHARVWDYQQRPFGRSVPDGFHHEIGWSISGILDVIRVDFTHRLDRPAFTVGVSVARVY